MATATVAKFQCQACGRDFPWKPEIAGKKGKCKCGAALVVPAAPDDGPAIAAAPSRAAAAPSAGEPDIYALAALAQGDIKETAYRCPYCHTEMENGGAICKHCKMNLKTGKKHDPKKEAAIAAAKKAKEKKEKIATGGGGDGQAKQLISLVVVVILLSVAGLRFYSTFGGADSPETEAALASLPDRDGEATEMLRDQEPIEAREFLNAHKERCLGDMTNATSMKRVNDWYEMGAVKVWAFNAIVSQHVVLELPSDPEKRKAILQWSREWQDKKLSPPPGPEAGQKYVILYMM